MDTNNSATQSLTNLVNLIELSGKQLFGFFTDTRNHETKDVATLLLPVLSNNNFLILDDWDYFVYLYKNKDEMKDFLVSVFEVYEAEKNLAIIVIEAIDSGLRHTGAWVGSLSFGEAGLDDYNFKFSLDSSNQLENQGSVTLSKNQYESALYFVNNIFSESINENEQPLDLIGRGVVITIFPITLSSNNEFLEEKIRDDINDDDLFKDKDISFGLFSEPQCKSFLEGFSKKDEDDKQTIYKKNNYTMRLYKDQGYGFYFDLSNDSKSVRVWFKNLNDMVDFQTYLTELIDEVRTDADIRV